jgi:hypothetical protein
MEVSLLYLKEYQADWAERPYGRFDLEYTIYRWSGRTEVEDAECNEGEGGQEGIVGEVSLHYALFDYEAVPYYIVLRVTQLTDLLVCSIISFLSTYLPLSIQLIYPPLLIHRT